jgi:hypothetical protein
MPISYWLNKNSKADLCTERQRIQNISHCFLQYERIQYLSFVRPFFGSERPPVLNRMRSFLFPLSFPAVGGKDKKMSKSRKKQSTTYTYWHWNEEAKKALPLTITAGQDGVTEEHIILLNEFDHAADLGDRYERENRDYSTENQKSRYESDPDDCIGDPIGNLGTRKTDPSFIFEQDVDKPNPLVEQLLTLMEKLTPQQIDLIYDLFGSQRQLTEIAKEEGKSVTAIYNRKSKIIARLKKLFAEQGIL